MHALFTQIVLQFYNLSLCSFLFLTDNSILLSLALRFTTFKFTANIIDLLFLFYVEKIHFAFRAFWSALEPSGALWSLLEPSGALWSPLELGAHFSWVYHLQLVSPTLWTYVYRCLFIFVTKYAKTITVKFPPHKISILHMPQHKIRQKFLILSA